MAIVELGLRNYKRKNGSNPKFCASPLEVRSAGRIPDFISWI